MFALTGAAKYPLNPINPPTHLKALFWTHMSGRYTISDARCQGPRLHMFALDLPRRPASDPVFAIYKDVRFFAPSFVLF